MCCLVGCHFFPMLARIIQLGAVWQVGKEDPRAPSSASLRNVVPIPLATAPLCFVLQSGLFMVFLCQTSQDNSFFNALSSAIISKFGPPLLWVVYVSFRLTALEVRAETFGRLCITVKHPSASSWAVGCHVMQTAMSLNHSTERALASWTLHH